jgi:hypothetical protein
MARFDFSERKICRVLDQPISTQRYSSNIRDAEYGQALHIFTLIDEYTRESDLLSCISSITNTECIRTTRLSVYLHGTSEYIRSDNGPELAAKAVRNYWND